MSLLKLLALTALFRATAFAQTEWKEFTFRDGNFRVLFPDNPQQQTGTERNLHEFSATAGAESYALAYADYSPAADWENLVNRERDSIVNGLGGSVVDEKRTSVEGYPGKWIRFVGQNTSVGSQISPELWVMDFAGAGWPKSQIDGLFGQVVLDNILSGVAQSAVHWGEGQPLRSRSSPVLSAVLHPS